MTQPSVKTIQIKKVNDNEAIEQPDLLAVEEPLEIRVGYGEQSNRQQIKIAVTMRTPGMDIELAVGFLFTEGIIRSTEDIESVKHCEDVGRDEKGNVIRVELKSHVQLKLKSLERNFYTTSSCGICGKNSIDSIKTELCYSIDGDQVMNAEVIKLLTATVNKSQFVFKHTGGIHASALFDLEGDMITLCEDVGRHNALDKLIGKELLNNHLPLSNKALWVSGRASFELVQKAAMAGLGIMVAVGAPSSLAVQLAEETGICLVGFSRNNSFNIYSQHNRIKIN
jgi:FdhD protein